MGSPRFFSKGLGHVGQMWSQKKSEPEKHWSAKFMTQSQAWSVANHDRAGYQATTPGARTGFRPVKFIDCMAMTA